MSVSLHMMAKEHGFQVGGLLPQVGDLLGFATDIAGKQDMKDGGGVSFPDPKRGGENRQALVHFIFTPSLNGP